MLLFRLNSLTDGERRFVVAHLASAMIGAILAFNAVMRMGQGKFFAQPLSAYEIWIILAGAIGGALGLYLNRHRMGQGGPIGVLQALGATVMANMTGAVICGTLALPLYGTMFGPFTMIVILVSSPMVFVIWVGNQVAAHLLMARYYAERDSIFVGLAAKAA